MARRSASAVRSAPVRVASTVQRSQHRPRGQAPVGVAVATAALHSCERAVARSRGQRRLTALLVGSFALLGLVTYRLVTVQVVEAAEYRGLAAQQTRRELQLPAIRGRIADREGEPLAMSLSAATVYANPHVLRDAGIEPGVVAMDLAPVLGRDVREIAALLSRDAAFTFLGRQLPRAVGEEVAALDLPGVGVLEEPTRTYPAGTLAAQVVGFTGIDNHGLEGLERAYDDVLAGTPGLLRLERAPGGLEIAAAPREVEAAQPGADLLLTIDREVQHQTEVMLAAAVERYGAIGGSAVVLDVASGEILAMSSVPTFDPASPGDASSAEDVAYAQRNRAVTDVFEPGSVNKVVTIAGALEEGVVTPQQAFEVPWELPIGPEVFHDSSRHATQTWTVDEIMTRSSNVGTIRVGQRLGEEGLHDYVTAFGLGRETGLGFPAESRGILPAVGEWTVSSLPTIAIGQGVSATLLQVAGVFATVARGGEWVEPRLVRGTVEPDGAFRAATAPDRMRVVSESTAQTVAEMLVGVVEDEHGTGHLAAVEGYHVGGKTGTAQKPLQGERGYADGAYIASFAGFAPADDPALVVAVMLDEPTPYYGGLTAAPTFAEIMRFALADRRVPPEDAPALPAAAVAAADPTG